jgi:hypothetical protein
MRNRHTRGRYGLLSAGALLLALAAVAVGAWLVPDADGVGDIDPLGAATALLGLAISLWALHKALQPPPLPLPEALAALAAAVQQAEGTARYRLLGQATMPIDVTYALRRAPNQRVRDFPSGGRLAQIVTYYRPPHPRPRTGW